MYIHVYCIRSEPRRGRGDNRNIDMYIVYILLPRTTNALGHFHLYPLPHVLYAAPHTHTEPPWLSQRKELEARLSLLLHARAGSQGRSLFLISLCDPRGSRYGRVMCDTAERERENPAWLLGRYFLRGNRVFAKVRF